MRKIEIKDRVVTDDDVFVVAEVGSNHMGDPDLCGQMIIKAAQCGVDAVKLQKRDRSMLTKTERMRPYENENSFGRTYGEHRDYLDYFGGLSDGAMYDLYCRFKTVAHECGVLFFATPFTEIDVEFLRDVGVDLWKIASCDAKNLPLVRMVAETGLPILASTGGTDLHEIDDLVNTIEKETSNYALLHCVSTYPNNDGNVNLAVVKTLRERYPDTIIGFSSHHPGLDPLKYARLLGAAIFEAHFTFDRSWKGADQSFSLEPKGMAQAVEDLNRVRRMLGTGIKAPSEAERTGFVRKMGKGLYLRRGLPAGSVIGEDDIIIRSPAGGLRPDEIGRVIGHPILIDCSTGVDLKEEMIGQ